VNKFSAEVNKMTNPTEKEEMKIWLEESFDATQEIENIIASAPDNDLWESRKQPRMYLDLDAFGDDGVNLTRTELLEASKSCYSGVLKKLTTIFTHAKLVEPDVVLAPQQRSIPLSLPPHKLFQIMPHLVVPGTLFSSRASAIMAVLALIVGVPFLTEPASKLLSGRKGKWLDVEVPENISYDCGKFLLQAPKDIVLTDGERKVYEDMRTYRLVELNLDSSLTAVVPWTPEKTREVGDRKVECEKCKIKRSVTMMSSDVKGLCGICAIPDEGEDAMKAEDYQNHGEVESCWVECSVRTCRAQYVVENVAGLRVKPKCFYCRNGKECPWQECTRCLNRVVVPIHLRSDAEKYLCPACDPSITSTRSSLSSIVESPTTTRALATENDFKFLRWAPLPDLFKGKSAFKIFQANGPEAFLRREPLSEEELKKYSLNGKPIHNIVDMIAQIEARVGKGEVEFGCCTLCFEDFPYSRLSSACGRSGCRQPTDEACLAQWYGVNKPGKLLSPMQLLCPFCRRKPTRKVLTRHNRQAAALGGLQAALEDPGWYYAWCMGCGFAKRAYERACCDGDRLPVIQDNFFCEECTGNDQQLLVRLLQEADEAARAGNDTQRRELLARIESLKAKKVLRITPCPSCGVMVEKTDGCNHITCQCGAHFCHVCGGQFEADSIYDHMSMEHGGFMDYEDEE
jgi:hypothetical protein